LGVTVHVQGVKFGRNNNTIRDLAIVLAMTQVVVLDDGRGNSKKIPPRRRFLYVVDFTP